MTPYISPWLVFYERRPAALLRLFCFHHAGGSASVYRSWVDYLPPSVELVAVQLPGREGRFQEKFITDFDYLVVQLMLAIQPHLDKPCVVFGHSMGSLSGFELIRKMKEMDLVQPHLLISSGRGAPQYPDKDPPISSLPEKEFIQALLKDYSSTLQSVLDNDDLKELFIPQLRADFELCENYQYRQGIEIDCPIVAYAGKEEFDISESDLQGWEANTSNRFSIDRCPGDHFFINSAKDEVLSSINSELGKILQSL